jgi:tRNA A37 methylthiotransferase MiaB
MEQVLVDSRSRRRAWELSGRTSGNTVVNLSGDPSWIGRTIPVRISGANPNSLRGDAVTGHDLQHKEQQAHEGHKEEHKSF